MSSPWNNWKAKSGAIEPTSGGGVGVGATAVAVGGGTSVGATATGGAAVGRATVVDGRVHPASVAASAMQADKIANLPKKCGFNFRRAIIPTHIEAVS